MATPLGSMHVELNLDSSKFASNLNASKRAVNYFRAEARALDAALKNTGNNSDILAAKQKTLQQAFNKQADVLKRLETNFKNLDPGTAQWEKAAAEIQRENSKLESLRSELIKTGNQLKSFEQVKAFEKMTQDVSRLESKIGVLDATMSASGNKFGLVREKTNLLNQAFQKEKEIVNQLQSDLRQLDPSSDKWEQASAQVDEHTRKLMEFKRELNDNNLFSVMGSKMQTVGQSLQNFGTTMTTAVTAPIVAGFGYGVKAAAEFQGGLMTTQALLRPTIKNSEDLAGVMNELATNSKNWSVQYGVSTSSINSGMEEMIKKGFDAQQTISAMPAILDASRASGEDFNTVMNASTNILQQFGLQSDNNATMLANTERVTNSLTYVANATAAGFSDMGLAMEYVGPVANSLNMSVEETAAAIGLMSNNGIAGEKAGTALRGALSKLLKPSEANAAAMEQLGFSAGEFQRGSLKLPDILDRIKESTAGMNEEQRAALIAQAFGVEAQTGMNVLIQQGSEALRGLATETANAKDYTKKLADEMGQSAQAKFQQAKEKLNVLAITIGEKLLPSLVPIVEKIGNLVTAFTNLSPEMQQNIIMWGLGAAAIGPFALGLGKVISTIGSVSSAIGSVSNWVKSFKDLSTASKVAADGITAIGTGASGATGATSGLAGAVAALGNPVTWGILLGGAAIAGLSIWGQQALDAKQRTEEWGTAVSEVQAKELSQFKSKVDESTKAMDTFKASGESDVEAVRSAFAGLTDEINKLVDKNLESDLKLAEKLGLSPEEIQGIKDRANETKETVSKMSEDVINIYKNANQNRRQLSEEEKQIVLSAQKALINEELNQLNYSGKEKEAIVKAMNGQFKDLNKTQLSEALEVTKDWLKKENDAYKSQKDALEKLYSEKKITAETYNREVEELEADHTAKVEAYGERYMNIRKELAKGLTFGSEAQENAYFDVIEQEMNDLGLNYDQLKEKMQSVASSAQASSSMVAGYWDGMSLQAEAAVTYWNSIVLDPVTGEIKTNAQEEIQKALQAEGGWENMQLSLKEGKLTTTAKMAIGEALVATGQWNSLSPEEKKLVTNNKPALEAILSSEQMLSQWNSLPDSVKELLGNNSDFLGNAEVAQGTLNYWNSLPAGAKELIAHNMTAAGVGEATITMEGLQDVERALTAKNMTQAEKDAAQATLDSLMDVQRQLLASNATQAEKDAAQATLDSLKDVERALKGKNLTQSEKDAAQSTMDSLKDVVKSLKAKDETKAGVAEANRSLAGVTDKTVTITGIFKKIGDLFEKGTDYHKGGPAIVNDQKGPLYRELITLPNGQSFIPEGRNVFLDLPRGSKVLPAKQTKALYPHYAGGVGYSVQSLNNMPSMGDIETDTSSSILDSMQQVANNTASILSFLKSNLNRSSASSSSLSSSSTESSSSKSKSSSSDEVTGKDSFIAQQKQKIEEMKTAGKSEKEIYNQVTKNIKKAIEKYKFSKDELADINKQLLGEYGDATLQALNLSFERQQNLLAVRNAKFKDLTAKELSTVSKDTIKALNSINNTYKNQLKNFDGISTDKNVDLSKLSAKEVEAYKKKQTELLALQTKYNNDFNSYKSQFVAIQAEYALKLEEQGENEKTVFNKVHSNIKELVKQLGLSREEANAISKQLLGDMGDSLFDALDLSYEKRLALVKVKNGQLAEMDAKELKSVADSTEKILSHLNVTYQQKIDEFKAIYMAENVDVSKLSAEQVAIFNRRDEALKELEAKRNAEMNTYKEQFIAIQAERIQKLKASGEEELKVQKTIYKEIKALSEQLHMTEQETAEMTKRLLGDIDTAILETKKRASSSSSSSGSTVNLTASEDISAKAQAANAEIAKIQDKTVTLSLVDKASDVARQIKAVMDEIRDKTVTVTVQELKAKALANGTNYHAGGLAMVNDQAGAIFKELVTLPSGKSFIPNGRNVLLDLPKGSKVLPANLTKRLMASMGVPRYASGVGFSEDSPLFKTLDAISNAGSRQQSSSVSTKEIESLLKEIIKLLANQKDGNAKTGDVYLGMDKVGELVSEYQNRKSYMKNRMRGITT